MTTFSDEIKIQSVNKFYLLEYFYILLKSIKLYSTQSDVLSSFIKLKIAHKLGESKYRKLTLDSDFVSNTQTVRYAYTMNQVINESLHYGLVQLDGDFYSITTDGEELIELYDSGEVLDYGFRLFHHMEKYFQAFRTHLEFCTSSNPNNHGLLLFPMYSPLKLGLTRNELQSSCDIWMYIDKLCKQISSDLQDNIKHDVDFSTFRDELISRLNHQELLSINGNEKFRPSDYNVILKRIRDSMIKFILNKVYNYQYSFPAFDIWIYRAKQIGVLHATEFFPSYNGRVIYPTSIIAGVSNSMNVRLLYNYADEKRLYIHMPNVEDSKEVDSFVDCLIESYLYIRSSVRNYYISLPDLREIVCFKLRIPTYVFDIFLERTYKLILSGDITKLRISLEADRLPYETNAMYLKREPSRIDGNLKNIIGLNMSGGII